MNTEPEYMLEMIQKARPEISTDEITLESLKDPKQKVFKCTGHVLFYYHEGKNGAYIKVAPDVDVTGAHAQMTQYKDGSRKIALDLGFNIEAFISKIAALCEIKYADKASTAFGCCNDFVRCSDAMKCLHAQDPFYKGCGYRKNLEAGRIFYGKNRNYVNPDFP